MLKNEIIFLEVPWKKSFALLKSACKTTLKNHAGQCYLRHYNIQTSLKYTLNHSFQLNINKDI